MKAIVYPADTAGCGNFRMVWPSQRLQELGHDIDLVTPDKRQLKVYIDGNRTVADVEVPDGCDVIVMQRVTNRFIAAAIPLIRAKGVAVVMDIDDDLSSIHPDNPAWEWLHPKNEGRQKTDGNEHQHNWNNLVKACRDSTMVIVTSPALAKLYAPHGRYRVIPNYLPDEYYQWNRKDNNIIAWPASIASHPNDPEACGSAIMRLVGMGYKFRVHGPPNGVGHAFGLPSDPYGTGLMTHSDWIRSCSLIGVGICPLADTRFNRAKSWLKPLEMAALRVPWVGSPREEYVRLHRMGTGILVDKPKDWFRVVKSLCDSESRRVELSEAGRAVAEKLCLRDNAWRWWEAWNDAVAIQKKTPQNESQEYVRV